MKEYKKVYVLPAHERAYFARPFQKSNFGSSLKQYSDQYISKNSLRFTFLINELSINFSLAFISNLGQHIADIPAHNSRTTQDKTERRPNGVR